MTSKHRFKYHYEQDHCRIWIKLAGRTIAHCWVTAGNLMGVQVAPDMRGLGYGKKLVRAAIRKGAKQLHVAPFNEPHMTKEQTRNFYRRLGWTQDPHYEWTMHYDQ
jgi:GNAT superfamily N-acetyltransferase